MYKLFQVPDVTEELVRQRCGGSLPTSLRHQGIVHCSVRAHHHTAAHLQGGGVQGARLLRGFHGGLLRFRGLLGVFNEFLRAFKGLNDFIKF